MQLMEIRSFFYEPENVEDCKEKIEKMLNNQKKNKKLEHELKRKLNQYVPKKIAEESEIFKKSSR